MKNVMRKVETFIEGIEVKGLFFRKDGERYLSETGYITLHYDAADAGLFWGAEVVPERGLVWFDTPEGALQAIAEFHADCLRGTGYRVIDGAGRKVCGGKGES